MWDKEEALEGPRLTWDAFMGCTLDTEEEPVSPHNLPPQPGPVCGFPFVFDSFGELFMPLGNVHC